MEPHREGQSDVRYALESSDAERRRLVDQGGMLGRSTDRLLHEAGLGAGMRVLDVGCGSGDVSLVAASIVGSAGTVVGVDRDGAAVAFARERARNAGLENVTFEIGDFREVAVDEPFDVVVGRLVLMYQGDPVAAVRSVVRAVRPGGSVVFQELDFGSPMDTVPHVELAHRVADWIEGTFRRSGAEMRMGMKLFSVFLEAGLPPPTLQLDSVFLGGGPEFGAYRYLTETVRSLLQRMEALGVGSHEEIDPPTLEARLREAAMRSAMRGPLVIGAWARVGR